MKPANPCADHLSEVDRAPTLLCSTTVIETVPCSQARVLALLSQCSHGLHASEFEGWRKNCSFEKKYGNRARCTHLRPFVLFW